MATFLWMAASLLLAAEAEVGGATRNCHSGCRCEVESFGLFDSFSLTRVDCSGLGLGAAARPVPIPLDTSHLDLSSNAIRTLSRTFLSGPGYTTLASLDLSTNLIATVEDGAFSRLRYLETLDLSHNALEGLRDGCFSGLPLNEVDLSENRLSELRLGVFPVRAQGGRPLSVDASANQLKAVTRGPGVPPGIQSLTLAGNQLTAVPTSLRGLGLRYLNLDTNPITEIGEGAFDGLEELVHLSLSGLRELTTIRPGAFRNLRSLQVLDMSDTPQLATLELEVFGGLSGLQELILSRSGVATLPQKALAYMPSLDSITLGADIQCWKTQKLGQFHRRLSQARNELLLTCNFDHVIL